MKPIPMVFRVPTKFSDAGSFVNDTGYNCPAMVFSGIEMKRNKSPTITLGALWVNLGENPRTEYGKRMDQKIQVKIPPPVNNWENIPKASKPSALMVVLDIKDALRVLRIWKIVSGDFFALRVR